MTQPAGLVSLNHGTGTTAGVSYVKFDGGSIAPNPFPLLLYFLYEELHFFKLVPLLFESFGLISRHLFQPGQHFGIH